MDFNLVPLYPKPQISKIFPDIYFDDFNCNNDTNVMVDDFIINDNLEPFDKFFNGKRSRNSSYDESDAQKLPLYKSKLNTPNSGIKFNFNRNEIVNNINSNYNINIDVNNNINNINNIKSKINKKNKNNKNEEKTKEKIKKKILFNSFQPCNFKEIQNQKQKQKIKNKLSARKSRLKKKLYVEQLEKEYILVKKELDEIKQKLDSNVSNSTISSINNNLVCNKNVCDNCINIEEIKAEENKIVSDEKKNVNIINSFTAKQRIIFEQLLIKQIQVMMPIKIKMFQNKYLKLLNINVDDNINIIKNKIEENLKTIQELYDMENFQGAQENGGTNIRKYKYDGVRNKSMAHQIYNFYYNLKNYVYEFEKIYFSLI